MHTDKVPSPAPANSVLTCRNEHLRHNASPPQQSATGTHHRYGPHTSCYTILDPGGSIPKTGTLVPAIGTRRHAQHMPPALDLRSSYVAHPCDKTLFIFSSKVIHSHQDYIAFIYAHNVVTIYWRSRWSRGRYKKGPCSFTQQKVKAVADLASDVYGR